MTTRYLRICLRAMLICLWAPTLSTAAALLVVVDGTVAVPVSLLIVTAMLSSLSGATALVIRIDRELRSTPGQPLPRPWLFAASHMLGSWLAGTLAFMVGQQQKVDVWFALGFVIVASFLGAKFIELMAEKYLSRVMPPPST